MKRGGAFESTHRLKRQRHITLMKIDGERRRLVASEHAALLYDSNVVAFFKKILL